MPRSAIQVMDNNETRFFRSDGRGRRSSYRGSVAQFVFAEPNRAGNQSKSSRIAQFSAKVVLSAGIGLGAKALLAGCAIGMPALGIAIGGAMLTNALVTTAQYGFSPNKKLGSSDYFASLFKGAAVSGATGGLLSELMPSAFSFLSEYRPGFLCSAFETSASFLGFVSPPALANVSPAVPPVEIPTPGPDSIEAPAETAAPLPAEPAPAETAATPGIPDVTPATEAPPAPSAPNTDAIPLMDLSPLMDPSVEQIFTSIDLSGMDPAELEQTLSPLLPSTPNPQLQSVLERLHSSRPETAAQAVKDLAHGFFNGAFGLSENDTLAYKLNALALEIDAGNKQALFNDAFARLQGMGTSRDIEGATAVLEKLVGMGHRGAEKTLEQMIQSGMIPGSIALDAVREEETITRALNCAQLKNSSFACTP